MKLTKKVEITENRYNCNIRYITTTWCGYNDRGEFIFHLKALDAFPESKMLTLHWYKDSIIKHTETIWY